MFPVVHPASRDRTACGAVRSLRIAVIVYCSRDSWIPRPNVVRGRLPFRGDRLGFSKRLSGQAMLSGAGHELAVRT